MNTAGEPPGTGGASILLIDDDPHLAALVKFRLEREGHAVEHIADGAAAIRRLETGPVPDLVVSDVLMPYRNGFEVLIEMRSLAAWSRVPVIMLTSMNSEKNVMQGLGKGADDYLAKPFRPAELVARVTRLLRRGPETA